MPRVASTLARARLNGDKVEISGDDPYNSFILPLVKAHDHSLHIGRHEHLQLPQLIVLVGVIDAPMVLVPKTEEDSFVLTPWIRVLRSEARRFQHLHLGYESYTVEMVHVDYFDEFLRNHLVPFAKEFAKRVKAKAEVLSTAQGRVPDTAEWTWGQIRAPE